MRPQGNVGDDLALCLALSPVGVGVEKAAGRGHVDLAHHEARSVRQGVAQRRSGLARTHAEENEKLGAGLFKQPAGALHECVQVGRFGTLGDVSDFACVHFKGEHGVGVTWNQAGAHGASFSLIS